MDTTCQETNISCDIEQANKLFQTGVTLIYGQRKSIDKAIKCIQKAITLNDSDYKYWQILGEAYYQRGSLNPAINCFVKSLKLVDDGNNSIDTNKKKREFADCIYSRVRMSDIRLSVGHLDEALKGYSEIIESDSDNLAAVVGLARTHLQIAQKSFSTGLVKSGHSQCIEALKNSLKAIKLCPHLCLTWKLASDCCIMQFIHGQRGQFEAKIYESFPDSNEDDTLIIDKRTCIKLAIQFLCKALDSELFQESASLWHNLGVSLFLHSTITQKQVDRYTLLRKSIKCLLKALECDKDSSHIKNSLAVVAFNLNLINTAQTYLIKSIQTNKSTSELQFSNLAYMYLQRGEYRLANLAFSSSQAEEPLYSRSWLGAALINQQNNEENLLHLRHCHKLLCNFESQLMYATKVAILPNTKEHRRDLVNALDCMKRVINYDNSSLEANNTLGLLYERYGDLEQARYHFEKAYEICPQDSRVVFNKLRVCQASKSCYIMTDEKQVDAEIDFIKKTEKLINVGNREYILNFIFYLFNNGDYNNVNAKMTKYMDKLPQGDIKSKVGAQILLGLAAKADQSDFKSWLYKNIIDLDNSNCLEANINLFCLMLFAALTKDQKLIEETSNNLSQYLIAYISSKSVQFSSLYYSNEGFWIRFAIFSSVFCLKDEGKLVRPILALFPTIPELWLFYGLAQVFDKTKIQNAIFCINKASLIGSTCADLGVVCDILLSLLSKNVKSKMDTSDSQVKYLCKAVYKCPNYRLLWKSLLSLKNSNESKKTSYDDEENSNLFYLAIDHTIKMIKT